jgi:hypothetical protein
VTTLDAGQQIRLLKLTHVGDAVLADSSEENSPNMSLLQCKNIHLQYRNSPRISVMHVSRSTSESEQSAMAFIMSCQHEKKIKSALNAMEILCHARHKGHTALVQHFVHRGGMSPQVMESRWFGSLVYGEEKDGVMPLLSPQPVVQPIEAEGHRKLTQHGGLHWVTGEEGRGNDDLYCDGWAIPPVTLTKCTACPAYSSFWQTQLLQLLIYY